MPNTASLEILIQIRDELSGLARMTAAKFTDLAAYAAVLKSP